MNTKGPYRLGAAAFIIVAIEVLVWAFMLLAWLLVLRELDAFRFESPWILRALAIGPVLLLIHLAYMHWRNRAMQRFANSATRPHAVRSVSTTRSVLQFLFIRHGLGLVVIALAGPQLGTGLEEVRSEGVDVMVCIDVSNSMVAQDLKPSRMQIAQRTLSQLIDRLQGDRLGMIVFAGEAFVQLPITTDRSAARLFLSSVNTDAVSTQGTAIGAAIELAHRSFDLDTPGSRAIIVISDGENHEDDAEGAARAAATDGIVVHTIGMGTPQGAPLPIERNGRRIGFRKDAEGNTVVSRLNEPMLTEIAAAGNGTYVRATERNTGIDRLLEQIRSMDSTETGTWRYAAHEARFQYPLAVGLMLIALGLCISDRRSARSIPQWTT